MPLDVGLAVLDFPNDHVTTLSPWARLGLEDETRTRRLRGGATLFANPEWISGTADAEAWWRRALGARFSGEVGGEGSALYGMDYQSSSALLGGLRLSRALGDDGGVALRVTGHVAGREIGALRGRGADAMAWWQTSAALLSATLTREETQAQLFVGPRRTRAVGVLPVRYTELSLGAVTSGAWGSLVLAAGARRDPDADQRTEAMWSANLVAWTRPGRGVTVSVGRQPDDFIHGADATQWASVGMRFVSTATRPTVRSWPGPVALVSDSTRTLRVIAAGAERVEVMGDFTDWEAVALERADDDFVLPRTLAAGTHRLMLSVDGGAWRPPANLPSMDDDFGGRVGVLAVP